jgi:hypothetical protein
LVFAVNPIIISHNSAHGPPGGFEKTSRYIMNRTLLI